MTMDYLPNVAPGDQITATGENRVRQVIREMLGIDPGDGITSADGHIRLKQADAGVGGLTDPSKFLGIFNCVGPSGENPHVYDGTLMSFFGAGGSGAIWAYCFGQEYEGPALNPNVAYFVFRMSLSATLTLTPNGGGAQVTRDLWFVPGTWLINVECLNGQPSGTIY